MTSPLPQDTGNSPARPGTLVTVSCPGSRACCQQWPWILLALCVVSFGFGVAVGRSTTDPPDVGDIWLMEVRDCHCNYVGTLLCIGPPDPIDGGFRYRDLRGEVRDLYLTDGDYTYPTRCLPPGWSEGGEGNG